MRMTTRGLALTAVMASMALTTAGCLQSPDGGGGTGGGGATDGGGGGTSTGAGGSAPGDGVVEVFGAFGAAEAAAFEASIADWETESGIDIRYTGNADFTTFVRSRVQGGSPPDIALFPQPGLLMEFAEREQVVPIGEFLDTDSLDETLITGFLDPVTDDSGETFGAPMRMAVKSLVWVPKQAYEAGGYSLEPASVQELEGIADEIRDAGTPPWCIGYESGAATGWVGTDWIEEMVLRVSGPEVYDQWVAHEIPFNDPQIAEAFEAYGQIVQTEGNVLGGSAGVLTTPFGESGNPSFEEPPACMLQRQGNFITGFFPEDVQADLDANVDVMVLPPLEGGYDGQPILGGGDMAALFNGEDDDAKQVMEFLASDEFGGPWAGEGGWLSPHTTFDASQYPDETTRTIAQLAADADVFRFDASDLMPAEVGAGTFWTAMVEWTSGQKTTEQVLDDVEASWPSS